MTDTVTVLELVSATEFADSIAPEDEPRELERVTSDSELLAGAGSLLTATWYGTGKEQLTETGYSEVADFGAAILAAEMAGEIWQPAWTMTLTENEAERVAADPVSHRRTA